MYFLDTLLQAIIIQWIFSHMVIGSRAELRYQGNWLPCTVVLHTWVTNLMECVFLFSHTALSQHNSPFRVPAIQDRWKVARGLLVSQRWGQRLKHASSRDKFPASETTASEPSKLIWVTKNSLLLMKPDLQCLYDNYCCCWLLLFVTAAFC